MTEMESRAERIHIQRVQLGGEDAGFLSVNWHVLTMTNMKKLKYGDTVNINLQTIPYCQEKGRKKAKVTVQNGKVVFTIEEAKEFKIILHSNKFAPENLF